MQQDLEVPLAEPLLIVDQFSQLNEADSEDIMRNIYLENLSNVVHNSLCVKVFVDVLRRCLVLVLAQQNSLEDNQSLGPYFPPGIFDQVLQCIQLFTDDFVVGHHHVAEQPRKDLGPVDPNARRGVVKAHEAVVEELAP